MKLSDYRFTDKEIELLKIYRDKQTDARLKMRFLALLLLAEDIAIETVAIVVGKSVQTIENWRRQYVTKGIESLNSFQYQPKQTFLTETQCDKVADWVRKTNPATAKHVQHYIESEFGVVYSVEGVRKLLKRMGLKVIRPKIVPGNPPTEEQQKEHIAQYIEMKKESEAGTVFLYGDGMHLIHQNIPGLCWGDPKEPPIIETNTGRKRLNILGAYNPDNHKFVHITGEENCDAERVIEYFEVILREYPQAPKIILILDNATYFKAQIVRQWLEDHPKLNLLFLPPYAPNLNLIERFWRFVKERLVKNKYYKHYKTFRANVFRLLNHVDQHVDELKTLMVEKFQIIKYEVKA